MLTREDIIGHRIVCIHATSKCADDLDMCTNTIELESGICFRIPCFPDEELTRTTIPLNARRLNHPLLKYVYGATITALLRPRNDDDFVPDTARLGLSTGKWLMDIVVAPHGTGSACIHVLDEIDDSEMVDLWQSKGHPRADAV